MARTCRITAILRSNETPVAAVYPTVARARSDRLLRIGCERCKPQFLHVGRGNVGRTVASDGIPAADRWLISPSDAELVVILLVLGLVVMIGLVLLLLGAIMEFVFVRMATDGEIRIRGYFSDYIPKELSLFFFRLGIAFILVALVVLPAIVVFLLSPLLLALAVLLVPILLSIGVGAWVVLRLTADLHCASDAHRGRRCDRGVEVVPAGSDRRVETVRDLPSPAAPVGPRTGTLAGIGFIAIGLAFLLPFGIAAGAVYLVFGMIVGAAWIMIATLVVLAASYGLSVLVAGHVYLGPDPDLPPVLFALRPRKYHSPVRHGRVASFGEWRAHRRLGPGSV